jgi:O-antigen/teichoic acid export membrane protein
MKIMITRRFFRHLMLYVGFAFFSKGLSFLLMPLYTHYLTPEDYGIYALSLTMVTICEPLLTFCLSDVIGNVYYNPRYDVCEYVSTCLTLCSCMFIVQVVCLLMFFAFFGMPLWLLCVPLVSLSNVMVNILVPCKV